MNFKDFLQLDINEDSSISDWLSQNTLCEDVKPTRYSIEINYRSKPEEMMRAFAKIALGYVSASIKQHGYHVKHVYEDDPVRILVSSRNWDDGEWAGVVNFHPKDGGCFVISKGFYNKSRKTVSIQSSNKCKGDSAAEIAKELHNMMNSLKHKKDRNRPKLKGVPLKRGPKQ
ncbi:MAG: hypothetical protein ACW99G_01400 [Candidatus Thorarchaeota archaeon]|jgi:hypothetical protein